MKELMRILLLIIATFLMVGAIFSPIFIIKNYDNVIIGILSFITFSFGTIILYPVLNSFREWLYKK